MKKPSLELDVNTSSMKMLIHLIVEKKSACVCIYAIERETSMVAQLIPTSHRL